VFALCTKSVRFVLIKVSECFLGLLRIEYETLKALEYPSPLILIMWFVGSLVRNCFVNLPFCNGVLYNHLP
jgi:hypothetical protein